MKYCPGCESEFLDSVTRCEDCNSKLISEDQWTILQIERKQEADEIFVRAGVAGDSFEADVMKDALKKEGIPVLVRSFQDTSFDGIYVAQKGFAVIEVPQSFQSRARAVLESLVQPRSDS
jgi:hypothetical protein